MGPVALFYDTFKHSDQAFWEAALSADGDDRYVVVPNTRAKIEAYYALSHYAAPDRRDLPDVLSLDDLILMTMPYAPRDMKGVSKLILAKLIDDLTCDAETKAFLQTKGALNKVYRLITIHLQAGLDMDRLPVGPRFAALNPVLKRYLRIRESLGWKDMSDLFRLAEKSGFSMLRPMAQGHDLFLWGFGQTSPIKERCLLALIGFSRQSTVHLSYQADEPASQAVHSFYMKMAGLSPSLRPGQKSHEPRVAKLLIAQSMKSEITDLARLIRAQCDENPAYFADDIALVVPEDGAYRASIQQVFAHYGLPVYLPERPALSKSAVALFVVNFLKLASGRFENALLIRFLRSPFVQSVIDPASGALHPIYPDDIASISAEFNQVATLEDWMQHWQKKQVLLQDLLNREDEPDPGMASQIDAMAAQTRGLEIIAGYLDTCRQLKSLPEFVEHIRTMLERFQFVSHLKDGFGSRLTGHSLQEISAYHALFDVLDTFLSLDPVLYENAFKMPEAASHLMTLFKQTAVPFSGRTDGIIVVSPSDAGLVRRPIVWVMGFLEDCWPGSFMSDTDAVLFEGAVDSRQPYNDARYQFLKLTAHAKTLGISYPRQRGTEELLPSHFLSLLDAADIRLEPEVVSPDLLYCHDEWAVACGRELREQGDSPLLSRNENECQIQSRMNAYSRNQTFYRENKPFFNSNILSYLSEKYSDYSFSMTQLQTYQECPHRYFFRYLLSEVPPAEKDQDISAAIWGILVHEILYHYHMRLKNRESGFGHSRDLLFQVAQSIFAKYDGGTYEWELRRLSLLGSEDRPGLLDLYLRDESENPLPLTPWHLELPFGSVPDAGEEELLFENGVLIHSQSGNIRLRGKIDMLLKDPDSAFMAVLDYKTGSRQYFPVDCKEFRHLQLPVYSLVAKELWPENPLAAAFIFYVKGHDLIGKKLLCVASEAKSVFNVGRTRPAELDGAYFSRLKTYLVQLKQAIIHGFFNVHPVPELGGSPTLRSPICRSCGYKSVCPYEGRYSNG